MTDDRATHVCRSCGSDAIASVDQYVGTCRGEVIVPEGAELLSASFEPGGETEIGWDSCEQIGWQCLTCYSEQLAEGSGHGETSSGLDEALALLVTSRDDYEAENAYECEDCSVNGTDCKTHGEAFRLAQEAILENPERVVRLLST